MNELHKRIEVLSPRQQELLLRHLNARTGKPGQEQILTRSLSPGYHRFWLLQKSAAPFHMPAVILWKGKLNVERLEQGLRKIVQRHVSLTTYFTWLNGDLAKVPVSAQFPLCRQQTWLPTSDQSLTWQINQLAREIAQRPFDWEQGLLRADLFVIDQQCTLVYLQLHQSLAIRRVMECIIKELIQEYEMAGTLPPVPALPDLEEGEREKRSQWWSEKLHNLPVLPISPGNSARPRRRTFRGQRYALTYLPEKMIRLQGLSQELGIPVQGVLLSLFLWTLASWMHLDDLVFGVSPEQRLYSEPITFLPDILLIRCHPDKQQHFRAFAHQIWEEYQASAREYLPLEYLLDMPQPERDLSYPLLHQIAFTMQPRYPAIHSISDATLEILDTDEVSTDVDMHLEILEEDQAFKGYLIVNADLFSPETVNRLITTLQLVLDSIHVDSLLSDILHCASPGLLPDEAMCREYTPTSLPKGQSPTFSALEEFLTYLCCELLQIPFIGLQDDLYESGGDSLSVLQLLFYVRQFMSITLPLTVIKPPVTIAKMVQAIQEAGPTPWFVMKPYRSGSPLVPIQIEGSQPPLFCIHPVGGDVGNYALLKRYLGPDQPIYGLQAQGIDGAPYAHSDIPTMAEAYLAAIREVSPGGPYILAGWSFGGVVAFEMARLLRVVGEHVPVLILFDTFANWIELPVSERPQHTRAKHLRDFFSRCVTVDSASLSHLSPTEQLVYMLRAIRRTGATPRGMTLVQWLNLLSVYEYGHLALHRYTASSYPGRIIAFYALDSFFYDPTEPVKWSALTGAQVEVELISGTHMTMFDEPHIQLLTKILQQHLSGSL